MRIAIIGRPNVGKSTLFNRLVGRPIALVDPTPGVTRDRREAEAKLGHLHFTVIDTAGLEDAAPDTLEAGMRAQTQRALDDADAALFLIDARAGLTPLDRHFAQWLRRSGKPIILVANKCEGRAGQSGALDAHALGLGEPIEISAEHGEGLLDLLGALEPFAGDEPVADEDTEADEPTEADTAPAPAGPIALTIIGRPNVGKSTLINRLLGEERVLTGPEPGVTRDAISIDWQWQGKPMRLVDTAGLRKRARVTGRVEKIATQDTMRAIRFANVAVLVLDAQEPVEKQDLTIGAHVLDEGRALVIALNKWDLSQSRRALDQARDRIEVSLPQAKGVAVVPVSALTGAGLDRLMRAVVQAYEIWNRRVPTGQLNRWMQRAIERHAPPLVDGRPLRLRYIAQTNTRPPTFALFASKPGELPDAYRRYLENGLRETFDLPGTPLRMMLRKGKNPYARQAE
jgi:GTP-binding protein